MARTNYNPLTTTPKDTVNNIILEARKINFPWNDVLDLTVKEWLECMVSSQRAQPDFFVGPPAICDTGYRILQGTCKHTYPHITQHWHSQVRSL